MFKSILNVVKHKNLDCKKCFKTEYLFLLWPGFHFPLSKSICSQLLCCDRKPWSVAWRNAGTETIDKCVIITSGYLGAEVLVFWSRSTVGLLCSLLFCCRQTTQPEIRKLEGPWLRASRVTGSVGHSAASAQPLTVAVALWLASHVAQSYRAKPFITHGCFKVLQFSQSLEKNSNPYLNQNFKN